MAGKDRDFTGMGVIKLTEEQLAAFAGIGMRGGYLSHEMGKLTTTLFKTHGQVRQEQVEAYLSLTASQFEETSASIRRLLADIQGNEMATKDVLADVEDLLNLKGDTDE